MYKLFLGALLLVSVIGSSLIQPPIIKAQQSPQPLDVTVSPIFFDFNIKPGEVVTDKIRLRNNTDRPLELTVAIEKIGPDDSGIVSIHEPTAADEYLNWLKIDQTQIIVPAREWYDVPFTLTIPTEAAFGYYYSVAFRQEAIIAGPNNTNKISGAAAVPILLNVNKDGAIAQSQIVEFETKHFINEYLPVDFEVKVNNSGNVHLRPHGNIFISGQGTKDLAILDVNSNLSALLPNAIRNYQASWNDGFLVWETVMDGEDPKLDKNGNPQKALKIHWDKLTHFRFGPYTANLLLVYDDGQRDVLVEAQTSFWVIPYTLIAICLVGLLVIGFSIRFMLKYYIRRELRRNRN